MSKAREYSSPLVEELLNETTPEEIERINKEMENEKQQTAVEWLEKEQDKLFISYQKGFMSGGRFIFLQHKLFEQAKEMEKDKHERFNKFLNDEKELGISDLKTIERIQWYYNTYFNETYGGNK